MAGLGAGPLKALAVPPVLSPAQRLSGMIKTTGLAVSKQDSALEQASKERHSQHLKSYQNVLPPALLKPDKMHAPRVARAATEHGQAPDLLYVLGQFICYMTATCCLMHRIDAQATTVKLTSLCSSRIIWSRSISQHCHTGCACHMWGISHSMIWRSTS